MKKICPKTVIVLVSLVSLSSVAVAQTQIVLEPKSAVLSGGLILTNDYIFQPLRSDSTNGGRALFSFTLTNSGDYVISARVEVPTNQANSLYVNIDSEPNRLDSLWEIRAASGFTQQIVTAPGTAAPALSPSNRRVFKLSPGTHRLIIQSLEAKTKVGRVSLLQLPPAPTGLRVRTPPR